MRFLVDTSLFIKAYHTGIEGLPPKVRRILVNPDDDLLISAVSLAEIAIKTSISRQLVFPPSAVAEALGAMRFIVLPYTSGHANALFSLPFFEDHRDPFDRMLIASAISENIPILTSDRQFKRYRGLTAIWR